jgi:hypothetical protein
MGAGHTIADAIAGLLLIALVTTLVVHKETKNVISAGTKGFAEDIKASTGYGQATS